MNTTCFYLGKEPRIFLWVSSLLFALYGGVLADDGKALKATLVQNDSVEITTLLQSFANAIRRNDRVGMRGAFLRIDDHMKGDTSSVDFAMFDLQVVGFLYLKHDSAAVLCSLRSGENGNRDEMTAHLKKSNGIWRMHPTQSLQRFALSLNNQQGFATKNGFLKNPDQTNSQLDPITGSILIPERHPGTLESDNAYTIHKAFTDRYLRHGLFVSGSVLYLDAVTTDLTGWEIGFNLDRIWRRIVFGWQRTHAAWLKSYGDNWMEYRFERPSGLAIDPFDTLFISDEGNGKLVKLFYDRNSEEIAYTSELTIQGIAAPCDVSYDQGFSVCDPSDDGIWVADYLHGQLVMINRAGSVVKRIMHYQHNGTLYPLRAEKVVASRFRPLGVTGPYIGVINTQRTYWPYQDFFVTLDAGSMNGTTAMAIRSTEYRTGVSPPHNLVSLGIDIFGQFWVGDDGAKQYHTYSKQGDYLASYASNPAGSPVSISRTRQHMQPGCGSLYSIISIHTADPWGANTGLNYFLPGADVVNLVATRWTSLQGTEFNVFKWTATNECYLTIKVRDPATGTYVKTIHEGPTEAGHYSASVPHNELPYGDLQLQVWCRPFYDHLYPHPQGDSWREITFHNRRPISHVDLVRNANTYPPSYIATVVGGTPPFNYIWTMKLKCCYGAFVGGGDQPDPTCLWQDADGFANDNTLHMYDPAYSFWVRVDVYDSQGSWNKREGYVVRNACLHMPGCPYLFTWDGRQFVEDNNILPQSEAPENRGRDVVDRYRLMQPPAARNDQYVMQLREFEQERSFIDQVRLIAVDHNVNREVAMRDDGRIVSYERAFKLKHARLRGSDVLQRVRDFDSITVAAGGGTVLDVGFVRNGGGGNTPEGGDPMGGDEDFVLDAGGEEKSEEKARPLIVTSLNNAGMSSVSGTIVFRRNPSINSVPITVSDSSNMQLVWGDSFELDYINLARVRSETFTVHELPLQSAMHGGYRSVREQLLAADSVHAELMPFHFIELRFATAPRLPNGRKRTFFFVSKGRYERLPDSSSARLAREGSVQQLPELPNVLAVHQGFPNPFNPTTTIRFDLPEPLHVSLVVYDVLGREVQELVRGYREAGFHSAVWNGTEAASGMYMARFIARDAAGNVKLSKVIKLILNK